VFGTQTTPPPPILKILPKIFAHADKTVRSEGTALAQVLYQYLGPGIEPWLSDLKPVQVKELKESFEILEKDSRGKGSLKPERMTRAQAREVQTVGDEPAGAEEVALDVGQWSFGLALVLKNLIHDGRRRLGSSCICRAS
jgi:cytoskeleton-associated protein 5